MRGIDLYACPGDGGLLNREGAVLIGQEHQKRAFLCFFVLQRHTWGPCRPKKKASPSTPAASSHQDRKKNGNTADDPLYCYPFSLPNVHPLTLPHGPIAQKSEKNGGFTRRSPSRARPPRCGRRPTGRQGTRRQGQRLPPRGRRRARPQPRHPHPPAVSARTPAGCQSTTPAQCSLKRGRTQAGFRKTFLSDGMLQHKIL